ncbi:hypothetical protein DPMN_079428 [Dreissena polymorpha]|uniref:Uncharacterized protein n=1 Tax=Dreissena polymorpha TaxID=45954 RepID=A0A9D4BSZ4_DREPO|nr:hypothetical protein DPMN_079428 [Dreissena polymorpha]
MGTRIRTLSSSTGFEREWMFCPEVSLSVKISVDLCVSVFVCVRVCLRAYVCEPVTVCVALED